MSGKKINDRISIFLHLVTVIRYSLFSRLTLKLILFVLQFIGHKGPF